MKRAHLDGTRNEIELGYLGLEVTGGRTLITLGINGILPFLAPAWVAFLAVPFELLGTNLGGRLWTFTAKALPLRVAVFCPKAALSRGAVEMLPPRGGDLIEPQPGQHQQFIDRRKRGADRIDCAPDRP